MVHSATYVGRIRTRAAHEYDRICRESRDVLGNGFGHLNAAPAELVVESAFDEEVEPEPMELIGAESESPCTPPNWSQLCAAASSILQAVEQGCVEKVHELLPPASLDYKNGGWAGLLVAAIERGDAAMVRLLLDKGARPDRMQFKEEPPLHAAVIQGNRSILKMLIEAGADVNGTDDRGRTILPGFGFFNPRITKLLLEAGARVDARDDDGCTALMHASRYGYEHSIRILLDHRADVNLIDNDGRSALMHAASGKYVDAIPLLLARGADLLMKDAKGQTALDIARAAQNETAVELLSAAVAGRR